MYKMTQLYLQFLVPTGTRKLGTVLEYGVDNILINYQNQDYALTFISKFKKTYFKSYMYLSY
jgi:hypothetical protein